MIRKYQWNWSKYISWNSKLKNVNKSAKVGGIEVLKSSGFGGLATPLPTSGSPGTSFPLQFSKYAAAINNVKWSVDVLGVLYIGRKTENKGIQLTMQTPSMCDVNQTSQSDQAVIWRSVAWRTERLPFYWQKNSCSCSSQHKRAGSLRVPRMDYLPTCLSAAGNWSDTVGRAGTGNRNRVDVDRKWLNI